MSGMSARHSVAPSLIIHDFNGKKAKIIQTCRQIDDQKSGCVKTIVFQNLLNCLDVQLDRNEWNECQMKHGITVDNVQFIKYDPVMRLLYYDNHNEVWAIRKTVVRDDVETTSVVQERKRNRLIQNNRSGLRQSFEGLLNKPETVRASLAHNQQNMLSQDALKNFDRHSQLLNPVSKEDEEAIEVQNIGKGKGTVSLKRGLDT